MTDEFWNDDCPERGPGLTHAHWNKCHPDRTHPGTDVSHDYGQCCHCEHTAQSWAYEQELFANLVDVDSLPLALANTCDIEHERYVETGHRIGDEGAEFAHCPGCLVFLEPKMATGTPVGPAWGPGRGWVNPRMKKRWEAIAFRVRQGLAS